MATEYPIGSGLKMKAIRAWLRKARILLLSTRLRSEIFGVGGRGGIPKNFQTFTTKHEGSNA